MCLCVIERALAAWMKNLGQFNCPFFAFVLAKSILAASRACMRVCVVPLTEWTLALSGYSSIRCFPPFSRLLLLLLLDGCHFHSLIAKAPKAGVLKAPENKVRDPRIPNFLGERIETFLNDDTVSREIPKKEEDPLKLTLENVLYMACICDRIKPSFYRIRGGVRTK